MSSKEQRRRERRPGRHSKLDQPRQRAPAQSKATTRRPVDTDSEEDERPARVGKPNSTLKRPVPPSPTANRQHLPKRAAPAPTASVNQPTAVTSNPASGLQARSVSTALGQPPLQTSRSQNVGIGQTPAVLEEPRSESEEESSGDDWARVRIEELLDTSDEEAIARERPQGVPDRQELTDEEESQDDEHAQEDRMSVVLSDNEDPDIYNTEDEWEEYDDTIRIIAEEAVPPSKFGEITYTESLLQIWAESNHISVAAFAGFARMVHDPGFNIDEVPYSLKTIKKLRRKLPLDTIHAHIVPVEKLDGDSKTKSTATCYYFDPKDVVKNWLENPQIYSFCHFGLARWSDCVREIFQGWLWRESVLAAISRYPLYTLIDNFKVYLSHVYPGAHLLFTSKKGNIPLRITGVFERLRAKDKQHDETTEAEEYDVWISVNIIVIRRADLDTFSINFETEALTLPKITFDEQVSVYGTSTSTEPITGYLVLYDFVLPLRIVKDLKPTKVFVDRNHHDVDPEAPAESAKTSANYYVSHFLPLEKGSTPKKKKLIDLFGAPKTTHQPTPPTITTRARSQAPERRAPLKPRGLESEKIIVHELVHTRHLRYLLAEDEIRKGEVSMAKLQEDSENGKKHIGVVIDFYTDKFGTFRTTHRSSGGMYSGLNNLNQAGRDQPRNHSLLGFVPNGGSFETAAEPIVTSLRKAARGFPCTTAHEGLGEVTVHVKVLSMLADMAESNGIAGIKSVGCVAPCRFCGLKREQFGLPCFHNKKSTKLKLLRQRHICSRIRRQAFDLKTKKAQEKLLMPHSIHRLPAVMESFGPAFNPFIQTALDTSHAEAKGLGEHAIGIFIDRMLSDNVGKKEFTRCLRAQHFPVGVSRVPNPTAHMRSLKMSEVSLLISVMPFLIKSMNANLKIFNRNVHALYNEREGEVVTTDWIKQQAIGFFLVVARANSAVFSRVIRDPESKLSISTIPTYDDLDERTLEYRTALANIATTLETLPTAGERLAARAPGQAVANRSRTKKVRLDTLETLPNFHTGVHSAENARLYGTNANVDSPIKERVHGLYKNLVPHTNYVEMDLAFCKYWNVMNAIRKVNDKSICAVNHPMQKSLARMPRNSDEGAYSINNEGPSSVLRMKELVRFPDYRFGSLIGKHERKKLNLDATIFNKPVGSRMIQGLWSAYTSYDYPYAHFPLTGFERDVGKLQWWQSVNVYDEGTESKLRIKPGQVIAIREEKDPEKADGYAVVIGICTHQPFGSDYDHLFFYVRWLVKDRPDPDMGGLMRYRLESIESAANSTHTKSSEWFNYVGLPSISKRKTPHFAQDAEAPNFYWLNEYFISSSL
ncbi:hypothetical protein BJ508DRAFT_329142 [Ascobolus immersus RN42]|uniref:BAH domain-containing protein n=1 Tax=Ascobolus immersus RN42 TaxID=1160509 RepID=A0A3N4HZ92_ASCIM|nr:hypothetical protein BJ508DRAFT_329142 [Ascobolus immersus RN42]